MGRLIYVGEGRWVLVLVEWYLVRFFVKVRLLERVLFVRFYFIGREEIISLSFFGVGFVLEGIRKIEN